MSTFAELGRYAVELDKELQMSQLLANDTPRGQAVKAAVLYAQIEELEESYQEALEKVVKHLHDNFSDFDYPDAPDNIYATELNAEQWRYGAPVEKRRKWLAHVRWAKSAAAFCEVEGNPYCRIEDDMLELGGDAWYGSERYPVEVEFPVRWLDLDRDGILADLARLKTEADEEERAAADVIEQVKAQEAAEAAAAAEAEEYENYLELKAKYEG